MASIAFLGLGTMGRGMVQNLLKAGHDVVVWNRTSDRAEGLGADDATTVAEAVNGRDVVMACLSDDEAVRDVLLGDDGVLPHVNAETLVVDLSTVSPTLSDQAFEDFRARGVTFVDAPVFGSKGEAAAGGLWVVVGAAPDVFDRVRPVLDPVSESVHRMGDHGAGARAKLVGNSIVAAQLVALGEALTLARAAQIDLGQVLRVLEVTDFRSPIFDGVGPNVLEGDYTPAFALDLMAKDVHLIQEFAGSVGVTMGGAKHTADILAEARTAGFGSENASALIKVIASRNGVDLSG